MKTRAKKSKNLSFAGVVLFASAILLMTNVNIHYTLAQTPEGKDTFHAKGYMGNLVLSPESLQALNASQDTNLHFITGGNWSLDVSKGQLQDFKVELTRHSLGGHEAETHIIDGLKNATAITQQPSGNNQILLMGNNTQFQGIADIKTVETNKVWKDVPVSVYLINGHILNISFDIAKTERHFVNLPMFGVVTSLTEGSSQANSTAT